MSISASAPKLKVLWLTNIATPYRIPVWQWLADRVELSMALLADTESNRNWSYSKDEIGVDVRFLKVSAIHRGERHLYLPSKSLRRLFKEDFDVVILGGWESPAYFYALWKAKRNGIRTVSHYGSTSLSHSHTSGFISKVRAWFYRQLDAHATYGTLATASLESMGISREKIHTGFNSVDHPTFSKTVSKIRAKQPITIGSASPGHNFLYIGQLLSRKNIESLVEAFSLLENQDFKLRIVGSGPLVKILEEQIANLGLVEQVSLVGAKSGHELFVEYAMGQTLVLPSTNEVWGLVVNEALASGLHVVVSDQSGVAVDIQQMPGVTISGISPAELATAMQKSAETWQGPIDSPEIAKIGPDTYGKVFLEALNSSRTNKQ